MALAAARSLSLSTMGVSSGGRRRHSMSECVHFSSSLFVSFSKGDVEDCRLELWLKL